MLNSIFPSLDRIFTSHYTKRKILVPKESLDEATTNFLFLTCCESDLFPSLIDLQELLQATKTEHYTRTLSKSHSDSIYLETTIVIVAAFLNLALGGHFLTRRVVDLEGTLHSRQPSNSLSLLPTGILEHGLVPSSFLPYHSTPTQIQQQRPSTPYYSHHTIPYHTIPYRQCLHQHANLDMSMSEDKKHDQTHHVPLRSYQSKYDSPTPTPTPTFHLCCYLLSQLEN